MPYDGFKNLNPTVPKNATRSDVFCGFMNATPNVDPNEEDEDDEQDDVEGDEDDEDEDDDDEDDDDEDEPL
jgi:hypothetical protein